MNIRRATGTAAVTSAKLDQASQPRGATTEINKSSAVDFSLLISVTFVVSHSYENPPPIVRRTSQFDGLNDAILEYDFFLMMWHMQMMHARRVKKSSMYMPLDSPGPV